MNLLSIRIITANIDRLVKFYEQVTGVPVTQSVPVFAEFNTPTATLAIGSTQTLHLFGGDDVAKPAENRSVIIEFRVEDVDQDYERLANYLQDKVVQKPTIMPWGNKSLLFRDPDGNLVNFFTPVTPEAIAKFDRKV